MGGSDTPIELGDRVLFQRHYEPELVYAGTTDNDILWAEPDVGAPDPTFEDLDRIAVARDLDKQAIGVVVGIRTMQLRQTVNGKQTETRHRYLKVRQTLAGRAYNVLREDLMPAPDSR